MIFPGMDPYLENPRIWPGVHNALIVYIRDRLQPRLGPRYVAAMEERVYVAEPERGVVPDVSVRLAQPHRESGGVAVLEAEVDEPVVVVAASEEVRESYVTILDLTAGQRVVTVIEVVSPSNKAQGPGRKSYQAKQAEVLASDVHLVEIDLMRGGLHVAAVPEPLARQKGSYDTLTCVNRAYDYRETFELYPRLLRDRLPRVRIPLADADPDVPLDIQSVLAQAYDAGRYRDRLDYARPCVPPLNAENQSWSDALLREAAPRP
jgi:hypothetical protein